MTEQSAGPAVGRAIRGALGALAITAAAAAPALARRNADFVNATISACLNADAGPDALGVALQHLGWARVEAADLTDDNLRAIAAAAMINDAGESSSPVAAWRAYWAIALTNSAGFRRLKTLPGATEGSDWFDDAAGDLLRLLRSNTPKRAYLTCSVTVTLAGAPAPMKSASEKAFKRSSPPIRFLRSRSFTRHGGKQTLQFAIFDHTHIADLLQTDFPYAGLIIVGTSHDH